MGNYGLLLVAGLGASLLAQAAPPGFRETELARDLKGGYQVLPFDVNRDGRLDLIALASGMSELVWFENPGWQRHTLAAGLKRMINVAACEGVAEMVVAHEFSNQPKASLGIVSVLSPGADPREPWRVREIDRLPTSHRLRCARLEPGAGPVVVNAPLAGAAAAPPDYRDRVPLVYYRPGEWKRTLIGEENEGVMHGIAVHPWEKGGADQILTASFLGLHRYWLDRGGRWRRAELARGDPAPWPKGGSSDVAVGHLGRERFLAAIEPWHGNQVVVYRREGSRWERQVLDSSFVDGHTILAADLDGDGRQEIIAGYRGSGRSVYIYTAGRRGERWERAPLDAGGMAAASCAAADLTGDGRLDIACIGTATANLKVYENLGGAAAGR